MKLTPNTTYTLSTDYDNTGKQQCLYLNGAKSSDAVATTPRSVTTGADGKFKIGFFDNRTGSSEFLNGTVYVMLNEGSTAETYEPFGTTYSFDWQSSAGTVYGGTLNALTGVLTVDKASATIGNITALATSSTAGSTRKYALLFTLDNLKYDSSRPTVIAERMKGIKFADRGQAWQVYVVNDKIITFVPSDSTVSSVNAAISGSKVVYELSEPITYQLTPTQVKTLLENNVWTDTGNTTAKFWTH